MINWLERRIQRFAIPNLTMLLIFGQVICFMAVLADPAFREQLLLVPEKVLAGEYHRLLSFLISPPGDSLFFAFFFWSIFYMMGTGLEQFWGTARYNLFLLIGYVATVSAAFIVPDGSTGNWFLQGTVFLAFAYLNPRFVLHIFFFIPVQIRWLAMFTWIAFGLSIAFGDWGTRVSVGASVLNFFLFFWREILWRAKHGQRHMLGQVRRFAEKKPEYIHKCVVCGLTDADDRHMDFRYGAGDLCYCSEHLKKQKDTAEASEPTE